MSPRLTQLLTAMTPQEQTEVETFAAFLIVRRQLQQPQLLTDDISVQERISIPWQMVSPCNGPVHSPTRQCGVNPLSVDRSHRGESPSCVRTDPDHLLPRLEDVLCLFISSAMPDDLLSTDFVLEPGYPSFPTTELKRRSVLRMHKLALLHKVLVLRVLGEGDQALMGEVDARLRLALGL